MAGMSAVTQWLSDIGLVEYVDKFSECGFDDLEFLSQVGLTASDVDALGVTKIGHRKKLMSM